MLLLGLVVGLLGTGTAEGSKRPTERQARAAIRAYFTDDEQTGAIYGCHPHGSIWRCFATETGIIACNNDRTCSSTLPLIAEHFTVRARKGRICAQPDEADYTICTRG